MQQQNEEGGAPAFAAGPVGERQRFMTLYEREHATTRKVLHAFPAEKSSLKPSDKNSSAHALAWTFVVEERMILRALRHEPTLGGGWPKAPEAWPEILAGFDTTHAEISQLLRAADDSMFSGTATFFTGPKQTGEFAVAELVTFMMHDQIHHRGQLSVYLRLAGARVPSIYGPSADEPWN